MTHTQTTWQVLREKYLTVHFINVSGVELSRSLHRAAIKLEHYSCSCCQVTVVHCTL